MVGQLQAPIDYMANLRGYDIAGAIEQHLAQAQAQKAAQAQQQALLQQQAQLEAAQEEAIRRPSAANYARLQVLNPAAFKDIKTAWEMQDKEQQQQGLEDLSAIRGLLRGGRAEEAQARIKRRIEADKARGLDTTDDQELHDLITEDPDAAAGLTDYHIAAVMGPDKWTEAYGKIGEGNRADMKLPGEIAKTAAETTNTLATAGKTQAETVQIAPNAQAERDYKKAQAQRFRDQTANEAARLGFDREVFESNTQLEYQKLLAKGTELSPEAEKQMSTATISAEGFRQQSNRAKDLADRVATAKIGTAGPFAFMEETLKGSFGLKGGVSALRKEFTALVNSQMLESLPPGAASDKDIATAKKGFPDSNANVETMTSFLRGMAKLQEIKANREQARADWISENSNIGRAKRDIMVNGVMVPAGTTYGEFSHSASAAERRAAPPPRSYMRYGQ